MEFVIHWNGMVVIHAGFRKHCCGHLIWSKAVYLRQALSKCWDPFCPLTRTHTCTHTPTHSSNNTDFSSVWVTLENHGKKSCPWPSLKINQMNKTSRRTWPWLHFCCLACLLDDPSPLLLAVLLCFSFAQQTDSRGHRDGCVAQPKIVTHSLSAPPAGSASLHYIHTPPLSVQYMFPRQWSKRCCVAEQQHWLQHSVNVDIKKEKARSTTPLSFYLSFVGM